MKGTSRRPSRRNGTWTLTLGVLLSVGCADLLGISGDVLCEGPRCSQTSTSSGGKGFGGAPAGGAGATPSGGRRNSDSSTGGHMGGATACAGECGCRDQLCPDGCMKGEDPDCLELGQECKTSDLCRSGFCADGVCCNGPCPGDECSSCNQPHAPGYCLKDDLTADPENCGECKRACTYAVCEDAECAEVLWGTEVFHTTPKELDAETLRCAPLLIERPMDVRGMGIYSHTPGVSVKMAIFDSHGGDGTKESNQPVEMVASAELLTSSGRAHARLLSLPLLSGKYFVCVLPETRFEAAIRGQNQWESMAIAENVDFDEPFPHGLAPDTVFVEQNYMPDIYLSGFYLE